MIGVVVVVAEKEQGKISLTEHQPCVAAAAAPSHSSCYSLVAVTAAVIVVVIVVVVVFEVVVVVVETADMDFQTAAVSSVIEHLQTGPVLEPVVELAV